MSFLDDNLKILTWSEIKEQLCNVNPSLGSVIDEFNPNNDFKFIKVTYRFGQSIMKDGTLHLPSSPFQTVPLFDSAMPKAIEKELGYRYIPMGVILTKKAEVFYESEERVMPTKIFGKGSMIGLWENFDPIPSDFVKNVWNVTAGARSVFLLPKISNKLWHMNLKNELDLTCYPPNGMLDHHKVFKEICVNDPNNEWVCEVVFFGQKWHSIKDSNDKDAIVLYFRLLQEAWFQSYNCRNNMAYDMAWEHFSQSVSKRNIKPKPLIVNTLKHMMLIYHGFYPGFAPSIDEECAPISTIIKAYEEIYKTSTKATIMEPVHLSTVSRPVYYSLQMPSLLENAPGTHGKNIIIDLRELQTITAMLDKSINHHGNIFKFFHGVPDEKYNIYPSDDIFTIDNNFQKQVSCSGLNKYASTSPFLKGTVMISLSEDRPVPLPVQSHI